MSRRQRFQEYAVLAVPQNKGAIRMMALGAVFFSLVVGTAFQSKAGVPNDNRSHVSSVKYDTKAKNGVCVPPVQKDSEMILRGHRISQKGGKNIEVLALARGIQAMDVLAKNHFTFVDGLKVKILQEGGFSNYAGNGNVNLRRMVGVHRTSSGDFTADNTAHFVHEIGHHIGHQTSDLAGIGKGRNYDLYRKYVRGYCLVSGYSSANPNEQFAEVIAAYVANPELLNNSDACKRAKFFMQTLFGRQRDPLPRCGGYQSNVSNLRVLAANKSLKK